MRRKTAALLLIAGVIAASACSSRQSVWADDAMWYITEEESASKTDVLYLVSTEVLSAENPDGSVSWRSLLGEEDRNAITAEMEWVENNMFHDDFNMYAPYYHQFTFDALYKLDSTAFRQTYKAVADEVCEAFDYYMEHMNGGREFILAGFSQGAMLTLDVLKHMTDEQYSRMAACYTIGYRLSGKDLENPHIKAAEDESGYGVVISFNSTMSREAIWPLLSEGAATCINPVNWKTDDTPAEFSFEGTSNTVHADPQTHVLLVGTDSPEFYRSFYEKAPFFLEAGAGTDNLHHWDLLFYPGQIHDNALVRVHQK